MAVVRVRALRSAGVSATMIETEVQVYSHRERDGSVLHANDAALEALRRAGEVQAIGDAVSDLPDARRLSLLIQTRLFIVQE
jgi:hypothetical protein